MNDSYPLCLADTRKKNSAKAKCVKYGVQYQDHGRMPSERSSMLKEIERERKKSKEKRQTKSRKN